MFPISDDNPRHSIPFVNWTAIAICLVVFLWQATLNERQGELAVYSFGMIPARLFGEARLPPEIATVPAWGTIFTSMFMHGGWLHLGGNMLYLWIFGDNIEDSMGHARYLIFYLLCGVAAAMAQAFVSPGSTIPMVGASGAISGVLGAYLLLHPRANVRVFIFLGLFFTVAMIPAVFVLGFWFVSQLVSAAMSSATEPGVAFWAHVGGFVAGAAAVTFFKKSGVDLLQPPRTQPLSIMRQRGPWG